MKIAITGHRPNKLDNDYNLTSPLISKIKELLQEIVDKEKPSLLISGMALGVDTLWAKIAHENKINLVAAIPCKNQDKVWVSQSKKLYQTLLENSLTTTIYISEEEYNSECMQKRNEWMVDNCDLLIAVWDGTQGGTSNCVSYAKKQNKLIIEINPDDIRLLINPTNKKIVEQLKKTFKTFTNKGL